MPLYYLSLQRHCLKCRLLIPPLKWRESIRQAKFPGEPFKGKGNDGAPRLSQEGLVLQIEKEDRPWRDLESRGLWIDIVSPCRLSNYNDGGEVLNVMIGGMVIMVCGLKLPQGEQAALLDY